MLKRLIARDVWLQHGVDDHPVALVKVTSKLIELGAEVNLHLDSRCRPAS